MSAAKRKKVSQKSGPRFDEAVDELEQILEQIETGELGLEESITRYERGMELVKTCQQILDRASKRIAELVPDADGTLSAEDDDDN